MKETSLKESLKHWTGLPDAGPGFHPRLTPQVAREMTKLFHDVQPKEPTRPDLDELHLRVVRAWYLDQSLGAISPREHRRLPWVLFYPPEENPVQWLGADSGLVHTYFDWLSSGPRTRPALTLLHEFLRVYPTDLLTFPDLRRFLQRYLMRSRLQSLPSARKWRTRCSELGILDSDKGHRFIHNYLSDTNSCTDYLTDAGFHTGLSFCNFLRSAIRAALPTCSSRLTRDNIQSQQVQRLLTLLEFNGKLRFDDQTTRVEVATALLSPFVDRPPPVEIKEALQSFFLRHYRDPRLPSGKHKWSGVPSTSRGVVMRWLVERVLEQFFLLLKETALDKHWRYREAFWRAFLDEGLIDDIWFALGWRAADLLKKMSRDPTVLSTTGQLRGAQSNQSVLLMRMPGVVIAEWSHSGSCHLWLSDISGAPKLYKHEYNVRQVRRPFPYPREHGSYSQRHDGSPTGRWQDAIARWLRDNTGLEIDRDLYFPRELRVTRYSPPKWRW